MNNSLAQKIREQYGTLLSTKLDLKIDSIYVETRNLLLHQIGYDKQMMSEGLIKDIDIAIEISKNAKYPYGAIVVKDNEIIGRSDDKTLFNGK